MKPWMLAYALVWLSGIALCLIVDGPGLAFVALVVSVALVGVATWVEHMARPR